jgi:hypothetical protein
MTASKTATVETLTAEVRVLMVGSRQVTMSVYKQLDNVEPDQIEPFGRVCPRDADGGHIHVVGRRIGAGELVASYTIAGRDDYDQVAAWRLKLKLGLKSVTDVPAEQIEAEAARLAALDDEWSALPLIVLAGLR